MAFVAKQEVINEDHPIVKDLLALGYSLGECLIAADKCSDIFEALEFLDETLPLADGK